MCKSYKIVLIKIVVPFNNSFVPYGQDCANGIVFNTCVKCMLNAVTCDPFAIETVVETMSEMVEEASPSGILSLRLEAKGSNLMGKM